MLVEEVMTKDPVTIAVGATLLDAAKLMRDEDCGILPVMDGDMVDGVITDRDLVVWAVAEGKDMAGTPLTEIMSKELVTCAQTELLENIADRMSVNNVRRLVVVDDNEKLVGIVSVHDLLLNTGNEAVTDEVIHHVLRYA